MAQDTHIHLSPSTDETIPTRHHWHLGDTQPVMRTTSYPTAPPPPPTRRHRRSCLSTFILLLFVAGGVSVAGYAFWQWTATRPRTNILVLGLDCRPDQGYVTRSDTLILATIYPPGPCAALLSIPRDLYVEIPDHDADRINTAHFWGENEAEGGGPALAMQTVAQNFGVPVHHYVRLDFDTFRAIVDSVGGVDVIVEKPVVDDAYPTDDYGAIHIEIPAGPQHMDGETALRYARSRHGSSDFDRARRQQQILVALAHCLIEPEVWPHLPAIYQVVMDNVDTDLTTWDLLLLAPTIYRVGPDGIEHRVIGPEMTDPWTTPTGGAVLLPRWEAINPLLQELFTP